MEVEDDVFFADLNKQISLLIMDDDEDPVAHCPTVSFQALSRAIHPAAQPPFTHQHACRRESKGTGVFIPQLSHQRRKSRQGKFNSSSNTKSQRHSENSKATPHQASHNSFKP
ncbi:hypothetical protein NMG60_11025292 [Bertholletia excelsa]